MMLRAYSISNFGGVGFSAPSIVGGGSLVGGLTARRVRYKRVSLRG